MKNLFILLVTVSICFLVSCSSAPQAKAVDQAGVNWNSYGEEITSSDAIAVSAIENELGSKSLLALKASGKIDKVCKKKGCWMTVVNDNGESMRVTFKDYGFFMPTDCEGREVVFEGRAMYDTTDVATLRHFAEDEGLSAEEIAKITEPEFDIVFEADGVLMK